MESDEGLETKGNILARKERDISFKKTKVNWEGQSSVNYELFPYVKYFKK